MPALNIIPFPARRYDPLHWRRTHRTTVRFHGAAPACQVPLPLPPESDLDGRILAAKATAGNYEELAAKSGRPVTKCLYERLAKTWNARVLALVAERQVQLELPPANGTTGGTWP